MDKSSSSGKPSKVKFNRLESNCSEGPSCDDGSPSDSGHRAQKGCSESSERSYLEVPAKEEKITDLEQGTSQSSGNSAELTQREKSRTFFQNWTVNMKRQLMMKRQGFSEVDQSDRRRLLQELKWRIQKSELEKNNFL